MTGFLGSGKTSLLLDLIHRYGSQHRIAVVQNEFAPAHTDGITLNRSGNAFRLLEINNGSVFCACLLSDFIERLEPFIRENNPEIILLEATGLADPVSLGQILHSEKLEPLIYLGGSWCLVDAVNFHKIIATVSRASHQIRIADLIWINKTDLNVRTEEIRAQIREINPFAEILETKFGSTLAINFPAYLQHPAHHRLKNPMYLDQKNQSQAESSRPPVGSCVVRANRYFDQDKVRQFVTKNAASLYRIKGFVRVSDSETLAVQTVFDQVDFRIYPDYSGPTEIIALGPDLDKKQFSKDFLSLKIS